MSKPRTIAIVIDIGWSLKRHHEVVDGIQEIVDQEGWEATLLPLPESVVVDGDDESFDGVIGRISPELETQTIAANIPAVNVWLNSPVSKTPGVFPDWSAAGAVAADHLLSRGLRRFAYLGWRNDPSSDRQAESFRAALAEDGFYSATKFVDFRFDQSQPRWERFSGQVKQWIEGWTPPVGVCSVDDLLGCYLIDFCRRQKLSVPDEVALVCSHNEPLMCELRTPSLTSIDMGYREVGRVAARKLGRLMKGEVLSSEQQLIVPQGLVTRRSTDVFAVEDEAVAKALRFISEQSHKPIKVAEVAAHVALSRRTIERRFKATLSRTVASEITRLRIERTKRQLLTSDQSIKSLAYQNGFRDSSHLCTVFLREVKMSPHAWRKARNTGRE